MFIFERLYHISQNIHDKADLVWIEHLARACLFIFAYGDGGGDVVAENDVEIGCDQLPGTHRIESGVGGQYFL